METIEVTSLSSKGQVVIPQKIRKTMKLKPGKKFVVIHKDDTIILKTVEEPSFKNFDELVSRARKLVKAKKLTKKIVNEIITEVRKKQKNEKN